VKIPDGILQGKSPMMMTCKIGIVLAYIVIISCAGFAFNINEFFKDTGLSFEGFSEDKPFQYHQMQNIQMLSFQQGQLVYGFAFFKTSDNQKYNDLTLQISEAFLANALCLDFLDERIKEKKIPKYYQEDYINYNLKNNISLKVKKVKEKRIFLGEIYLGYLLIVDQNDISVALLDDQF
jgi:hypothetical protein